MNDEKNTIDDIKTTLVFFTLSTLMLIIGYFIYPYPPSKQMMILTFLPLYLGLFFLVAGVILKKRIGSILKAIGWFIFAFYWSMQPAFLYYSEAGDIVNAVICILGVYVLTYMGYHEYMAIKDGRHPSCLDWIAGGAAIAGLLYYTVEQIPALRDGLIQIVTDHTVALLSMFGIAVEQYGNIIVYNGTSIMIIFACTAIQSMALFVGMIGAIPGISAKKRLLGILSMIIPIYFLNLIRNSGIVWLVGSGTLDFSTAHNIVGKFGSLLALILLLLIVVKITPELFDELSGILNLPKEDRPIERTLFSKLLRGTKKQ